MFSVLLQTKSEMQVVFSVSDSQGVSIFLKRTRSPSLSLTACCKCVVSCVQVVKDTVNIQIGDVNDNAPFFHNQPYTVNIPEVWIDVDKHEHTEMITLSRWDCNTPSCVSTQKAHRSKSRMVLRLVRYFCGVSLPVTLGYTPSLDS